MNHSRLRRMLDKLFARKKLSVILPLVTATIFGVLAFVLYNPADDNGENIWLIPIVAVLSFVLVYGFLRLLISLKYCPGWYIDTFFLLLLLGTGISAIVQIINIFIDFQSFSSSLCVCIICWSAVAAAHNRRNIYRD